MFCEKCQSFWDNITSQMQFETSSVQWPENSATIHDDFGSLMRSSSNGCPPCRAIFHAVTREGCPDIPANTTVLFELDPQDGMHPVLSSQLQTSQGHVIIKKFIVAEFSELLEDNDLPSALSKCQTLENQSTGSDSAMELARFWIDECLSKHQKCGFSSSPLSFLPTRVLDLANECVRLVATSETDMDDRRYITLSHCWGTTQMFTTTKATLDERHKGIRMSDMSKTLQDAVQVTRKLGFRYLWIDSLCIIQDDSQDWEKESAQMCQVYSHGTFNITAAHAPNGSVGCFVQRDGLLHLPLSVKLAGGKTALFTLYDLTRRIPASNARSRESGGNLGPPLFGRAWVFQEQILSRRMLIFNGSEMSWQCLCGHGTERYPVVRVTRYTGFHKSVRHGITEDGEYFNDDDIVRRNQHSDWCDAVMDYTHRGMTVVTDRLIAITGIADAIQRKTKNTFLVGLWKSELWLGLLWSIPHGREYTSTTSRASDFKAQSLRKLEDHVAPTWSWISVTGPVVYPTAIGDPFVQRICTIGDVEISGPPARKTGVMRIQGHTRTAYINSIYPYAFGKGPDCPDDMTFSCPDVEGQEFEYKGRKFHPNTYFIFSDQRPTRLGNADWRLMRGMWRPDEVVPPDTSITFLAIAQQNHGRTTTQRGDNPLQVFTIGLIPLPELPDTYRRVGYAVWDDCAWYGYNCSSSMQFTQFKGNLKHVKQSRLRTAKRKIVEKIRGWTSRGTEQQTEQAVDLIEDVYPSESGFHGHEFGEGRLPELSSYHDKVDVRIKTLQVV